MQCQSHNYKKVTHKCATCKKFVCGQCSKPHIAQRHDVMTCLQLAEIIKEQIKQQINRMNLKITQLCILKEYESGENVIDSCMGQIIEYVKNLFEQIKMQYRKISDNCWKQENIDAIREIEQKKNLFEEWRQTIHKKPEQATYFDTQKLYQSNKIDSDEELIQSSQSFIFSNLAPKVQFNETALRRANQSLTKIIYSQTKFRPSIPKKIIKKISSKKSLSVTNSPKKLSLCKFIEGTNILVEFIIQDPEFQQSDLTATRIQFREFVTPMRSTGITIGTSIYLIGGYGKQNKPKKQVLMFERAYTSMRVIGLLKQGRVGHAVCSLDENIYVFGGKQVKTLQIFNTKTKSGEVIGEAKQQITGSSMIAMGNKLYIFGGTDGVQTNKNILCFNLINKRWQEITPLNIEIFSMPISPILQSLSEYEILIYGGYFTFAGQSFNNNYMILYDTRLNYISVFGKGELIYPIHSNADNSVLKDNKIYCLADLKRQRHKHGPNLAVIFTYSLVEELMQIDSIGL